MNFKDTKDELYDAMKALQETGHPFAIGTCRSGMALDMCRCDVFEHGKARVAYTYNNNDKISEMIYEGIRVLEESE